MKEPWSGESELDVGELKADAQLVGDWLVGVAQLEEGRPPEGEDTRGLAHREWRGALRGEYSAAERKWSYFCPVWHTGQGVKSLVDLFRLTGEEKYREGAEKGVGFLGANRVGDEGNADYGMLEAYEDFPDGVNTSAVMEAMAGLWSWSDLTGDAEAQDWCLAALDWVVARMYLPGEGLFRDVYQPTTGEYLVLPGKASEESCRRPLLDDAVFLEGYRRSGKESFRNVFYEVAERLLRDEDPPGNWISFHPASIAHQRIHPRHAYWWGKPMIEAYRESGNKVFRDCARRAGEWYVKALRRDGGLFRGTYTDFNSDSFGHATSGSACAGILFHRLAHDLGMEQFLPHRDRALGFCRSMILRETSDPNLHGAVLEKVLPPGGTDRHPYHLRDLGSVFFVQLACMVLQEG